MLPYWKPIRILLWILLVVCNEVLELDIITSIDRLECKLCFLTRIITILLHTLWHLEELCNIDRWELMANKVSPEHAYPNIQLYQTLSDSVKLHQTRSDPIRLYLNLSGFQVMGRTKIGCHESPQKHQRSRESPRTSRACRPYLDLSGQSVQTSPRR